MSAHSQRDEEADLFSYVVASGDMRFIEIGERDLFLRDDAELGLVIRGEVPECGPVCFANLSQILLEYVMGCEDCRDAALTGEAADQFGRKLGRTLVDRLYPDHSASTGTEPLQKTMTVVVRSLSSPFEEWFNGDELSYRLAYSPIHETAGKSALNLWIPLAHRALVALCQRIQEGLAPDWSLTQPAERESEAALLRITFNRT